MKIILIMLLCGGFIFQTLEAQSDTTYLEVYIIGKQYQDNSDYQKAIAAYTAAIELGMPKSDDSDIKSRIDYCAGRLEQLKIAADSANLVAQQAMVTTKKQKEEIDRLYRSSQLALVHAKKMQEKAETVILERAIKDRSPNWKGFSEYSRAESLERDRMLGGIDSLDLSDNGLLRIPRDVLKCFNLKHLNLFGNPDINWEDSESILNQLNPDVGIYVSISDLKKISSSYWHFITGIALLTDTLKHLPQNILDQKQLKCLIADGNELEILPSEIGYLTNLIKLSLYENKIEFIPSEIGKLTNLTILDLRKNRFKVVPPEFGMLKNLEELYLDNNSLNTLPKEIGELTKLTTLSLYDDNLSALPSELYKLNNLTYLDLGKNKVGFLSHEIGNLTKLTTLSLANNNLGTLPEEIWNLNKLSYLNLKENNITVIPNKIGNLTRLTTLNLRSNGLTDLPAKIGMLTKLSTLSLVSNNFQKRINELGSMTNLTALGIELRDLKLISKDLENLKNLKTLYLFGSAFDKNIIEIKRLESLTTLYLIGYTNESEIMIPAKISELANLTKLGINIVSMSPLPPEIGEMTNLKHLDLVDTKIDSIPDELFNLNLTAYDFFGIGQKLYEAHNYKQALKIYLKCIDIDSTYEYAFDNIGLCLRMMGKPQEGLKYLTKSYSFNEKNTWRLNHLSFTYAAMDSVVKAFEYAEKSNSIERDPSVWHETGNLLAKVNNEQAHLAYEKAYTVQKQIILIDSKNYINWYGLSWYCLFVGKYTEAINAAEKSLELAPEMISVETNLALGYLLNNQFDKAKPIYQKWKNNKKFSDRDEGPAKAIFLKDIEDLESAKITHADFEEVRKIFQE